MPRPEKVQAVAEIKDYFAGSSASFLTEYRGLTVARQQELRRALGEAGARYKVLKMTLTRRALHELGHEGLDEWLTGPYRRRLCRGRSGSRRQGSGGLQEGQRGSGREGRAVEGSGDRAAPDRGHRQDRGSRGVTGEDRRCSEGTAFQGGFPSGFASPGKLPRCSRNYSRRRKQGEG